MNTRAPLAILFSALIPAALAQDASSPQPPAGDCQAKPVAYQDASVHAPAFDMPASDFASAEAKALYGSMGKKNGATNPSKCAAEAPKKLDIPELRKTIVEQRKQVDETSIMPRLKKVRARWPDATIIEPKDIGGVYTESFAPKAGIAPENRHRVLLNMHGGGFMVGARIHGQLESIPIAARGRIKVVSVDYRMAPEYTFPAASEDVATVYKELLKEYPAKNIGLYGCSAGGMLTAQAVAWMIEHKLPVPGAIGMFSGTGTPLTRGDSAYLAEKVYGTAPYPGGAGFDALAYFIGVNLDTPLAEPMRYPKMLAQFPPSLLLTGARAFEASSLIDANNKLTLAGAKSRLHLWDGLGHCFLLNADLPETEEAEKIVVQFFNETLGR